MKSNIPFFSPAKLRPWFAGTIFLCILADCLSPGNVPQSNSPYIDPLQQNTVWNIAKHGDWSPYPVDSFKLMTQGDSVLNGRHYIVVTGKIDTNTEHLLLRDSSGAVYRYFDSGEVVESNMNLAIGDTFKGMQVYSVDTIVNTGIYRKRIQLGWCNRVFWIEGIYPFIKMLNLNDTCTLGRVSGCDCQVGGSYVYSISSIFINGQMVYKE
jgi:hypothetical protein